jgi:cyclopropane-fatty-acyl-phospholipid synthase
MQSFGIKLAEMGYLPDPLIRLGIRKRLQRKLKALEAAPRSSSDWVALLTENPVATNTDAANQQHYEVPTEYFQKVLGPHLKYSSGLWDAENPNLENSESSMLKLSCERAELKDGQRILELGCGWGSLSLFMAVRYPNATITAVSNSSTQRKFITEQAKLRKITNLEVITCDINNFQPNQKFDRVVSVEMFEHVRNHSQLFNQIAHWLNENGKIFIHIFTHQTHTFLYEANDPDEWMSRYFFTGGIMPAADLLPCAANDFEEEARWNVNGKHYQRTLDAWLAKHDEKRDAILKTLKPCYGDDTKCWFHRWRLFYLACSELFGYKNGQEWCVTHYRFTKKQKT